MNRNTCGLDRLARLVVGAALLAFAARDAGGQSADVSTRTVLVGYLGAEVFTTGLTQWCPLNALLGRNTCAGSRPPGARSPAGLPARPSSWRSPGR